MTDDQPTNGSDTEAGPGVQSELSTPTGAAKMTAAQTLAALRKADPSSYYLNPTRS